MLSTKPSTPSPNTSTGSLAQSHDTANSKASSKTSKNSGQSIQFGPNLAAGLAPPPAIYTFPPLASPPTTLGDMGPIELSNIADTPHDEAGLFRDPESLLGDNMLGIDFNEATDALNKEINHNEINKAKFDDKTTVTQQVPTPPKTQPAACSIESEHFLNLILRDWILAGSIEQIRLTANAGANLQCRDAFGDTLLHIAAKAENLPPHQILAVITELQSLGADINATDLFGRQAKDYFFQRFPEFDPAIRESNHNLTNFNSAQS